MTKIATVSCFILRHCLLNVGCDVLAYLSVCKILFVSVFFSIFWCFDFSCLFIILCLWYCYRGREQWKHNCKWKMLPNSSKYQLILVLFYTILASYRKVLAAFFFHKSGLLKQLKFKKNSLIWNINSERQLSDVYIRDVIKVIIKTRSL